MEKITLYLKLEKNVEIPSDDIILKDLGSLYCKDDNIVNKCKNLKYVSFRKEGMQEKSLVS